MKKYISIDIGGTTIKYGLISETGEILESSEKKTEAYKGGPAILEKVLNIVEEYKKDVQVSGVCISTAGMVDIEKGEIFYSAPLIPNFIGTRFKAAVEEKFQIPCEVENDVNCAGLAEYVSGAAKNSKVALVLTIGTGIGGCAIIDGNVFRGFSGSACEVGYMHMDGSDFQTLGATSILTQKVTEWKKEPEEKWDGKRIFGEAKKGDELCIRAIDEMVEVLGKGISNICYVLNPEVVVLGGGIMAQEDYLRERIERALDKWLVSAIRSKTRLEFASHQNYAGMIGAFYHFRKMQERKQER